MSGALGKQQKKRQMGDLYECVGGRKEIVVVEEEKDVSLEELKRKLQEFAIARGWQVYHSPRNLLLALVGEVGELSEIFQWKGEVARGLPDWTQAEKDHLADEISDVLLYLIQLADVCGLHLGKAAFSKILKNSQKYPSSSSSNSSP